MQAARALPPADREKALEIIAEAAVEARRIDVSDPDRGVLWWQLSTLSF